MLRASRHAVVKRCWTIFYYKVQFEKLIEHHTAHSSGGLLIYSHYLVVIGLSGLTVSFSFLHDPEVQLSFAISWLYCALFCFYLCTVFNQHYHQVGFRQTQRFNREQALIGLSGFALNWLFFGHSADATLLCLLITIGALYGNFRLFIGQFRKAYVE